MPNPTGNQKAESAHPIDLTFASFPDRQPHPLKSDRGSVVFLDVWATWCAPCQDALPMYQDLAQQYGSKGLKVYALSVDEDPKQIGDFLQTTKVTLPVLLDPGGDVASDRLGVTKMPTTFIIDRHGVVRFVHEGFAPEFLQKYQTEIEQLLAEAP
jgi:thiol-disulfide isomerase/thioredoxin